MTPKSLSWRKASALLILALMVGWAARGAQQVVVSGKGSFSGAMLLSMLLARALFVLPVCALGNILWRRNAKLSVPSVVTIW